MKIYHVQADWLEDFRRVLETDYGKEGDLILDVRRPHQPLARGSVIDLAWRYALRSPVPAEVFSEKTVNRLPCVLHHQNEVVSFFWQEIIQARIALGPGLRGVPGLKLFLSPSLFVHVHHTAQHLHGLVLQHNRAVTEAPNLDHYDASLDWRIALLCHDVPVVRYNFWRFKVSEVNVADLQDVYSLRYWSYPHLLQDMTAWVWWFIGWCEERHLLSFLERKEV